MGLGAGVMLDGFSVEREGLKMLGWGVWNFICVDDVVEMEAMRGPVRCCVGRGGEFVLCYTELLETGPAGVVAVGSRERSGRLGIGGETG